jgi:hypothetical protein
MQLLSILFVVFMLCLFAKNKQQTNEGFNCNNPFAKPFDRHCRTNIQCQSNVCNNGFCTEIQKK